MQEKFKFFLEKLRSLPECRNDEFYRLADYIELKCLVHLDGQYSLAEFVDDATGRATDLGEGDFEDNVETNKLPNAQRNDKWETIAQDSFRVIKSRISLFGDFYPFILSENHRAVILKESTEKVKLYIFLLLCSNLKYSIKFKGDLTSSFESACLEVCKRILPKADLHLFGSSNSEVSKTEWKSTKLWDKLKWMEDFLKEELRINEDDISKYDKGDRGIDIIGKSTLGDGLTNFPIYFGQCACSPKQWPEKQESMKDDSWFELIRLSSKPNCFMFIPHSYRNATGEWHDRTKFKRTAIFDRFRILKNMGGSDTLSKLSSSALINEMINIKESTF